MESVLASRTVFIGQDLAAGVGTDRDTGNDSVMAIPISNDRELVGVVGLADRAGAYTRELLDDIQPLVTTYANLILARRNVFSRQVAEQRVKAQDVLLTQKQNLLQEIHHRVKNYLQIISSLLTLQLSQTKTPEVAEQLKTARSRISAVAMLHEVLYRSDSMECVDLGRFLGELRNRIKDTFGASAAHVALDVEAPPAIGLSHDQAGPLALIVNELATNSLKHAFIGRDGGHISIKAAVLTHKNNGHAHDLRVQVEDDGAGYENGPDATLGPGLGAKIADRLTAQLGGTLVRQSVSQGTRWELTIPLGS
jgi:two-component sensor histidine kinase